MSVQSAWFTDLFNDEMISDCSCNRIIINNMGWSRIMSKATNSLIVRLCNEGDEFAYKSRIICLRNVEGDEFAYD